MTNDDSTNELLHRPEWRPHWPRPLNLLWLLAAAASGAVVVLAVVTIPVLLADHAWGELAQRIALVLFLTGGVSVGLTLAGLSRSRVPKSVGPIDDAQYGPGVLVRRKSRGFLVAGLLALAWFLFASGGGFGLFAGLLALASAITVSMLRRTQVSLHVDGILRSSLRFGLRGPERTREFLRWEDIDGVKAEIFYVRVNMYVVRNPIIRIQSARLVPKRTLQRDDTHNSIVVRAHELAVDPNSLMALISWCRENSWARAALEDADARLLLESPPLRERLRLSRDAPLRR